MWDNGGAETSGSMRDLSATEHTDWIFSSGELPTLVIRSILLAIVRT
jgi:hypothetical protein